MTAAATPAPAPVAAAPAAAAQVSEVDMVFKAAGITMTTKTDSSANPTNAAPPSATGVNAAAPATPAVNTAPQTSTVVHAKHVCPDSSFPSSAAGSGSSTPLSACEAAIATAAIDYCVSNTLNASNLDTIWSWAGNGLSITATALSAALTAATGAKAATTAEVAAGTLILTNADSSLLKLLPTSPPTVQVSSLESAATAYVSGNSTRVLYVETSDNADVTLKRHYQGLWNAVGTACPASAFRPIVTPAPGTVTAVASNAGHP